MEAENLSAAALLDQAAQLRHDEPPTEAEGALELIVFQLADERYALPADTVRAVVGNTPITPLPGTPGHLLGLINQRGEILSVVDFRPLLGLGAAPEPSFLVIAQHDEHSLAVAADSCPELLRLPGAALERPLTPSSGGQCLKGQVTLPDTVLFVLDLAALSER